MSPRLRAVVAAGGPAVVAFVVYCVFSLTRHYRFGSGSWDMGCHVHNLWLIAHPSAPPISSVLGDAHFWGGTNHFMPSLYLALPFALWPAGLLVLQAFVVAAAVLPLALLAHRRGLGPFAIAGVSLAYLFAVGTQTTINFDVHETAPVPLLLFASLLAWEERRYALALVALVVLAGLKEGCIVYAAGAGLYFTVTSRGRRLRLSGLAIFVALLAWFFVVTALIQPAFLEEGSRGMIHVARFRELGATPGEIVKHILLNPLDTIGLLFAPAPKSETLAITTGGFAFLPLLAPEALLLAGPNLAERFLSNKREMWGLGFHYSLTLVGVWAFASVLALARLLPRVSARLPRIARHVDGGAGAVVVAALVISHVAAPFPPEFATLHKPYMASDGDVERYRRALAAIPEDDAVKVAAQNHFLPHLAYRQFIWQPHDKFVDRADFVILDDKASPWPHSPAHVRRLIARLRADSATWRVVFDEGSTVVFARVPQ